MDTNSLRFQDWWASNPQLHKPDIMEANVGVSAVAFFVCFYKYCGANTALPYPDSLYYILQYLKNNNVVRTLRSVDGSVLSGSGSRSLTWIKDACGYLASVMDEVDECWHQRRGPHNIIPDTDIFDDSVIGCVDTTPIVIDNAMSSAFYNGKYKQHVLKVQLVCDNRGRTMWYSGPHIGTISDSKLWENSQPPFSHREKVLGDLAYIKRQFRPHLIPPIKKDSNVALDAGQSHFNSLHGFYRSTIEHVFGYLKRFQIFGGKFRGVVKAPRERIAAMKETGRDHEFSQYVPFLTNAVKIIIHLSNIHLKMSPKRTIHPVPQPQLDEIFASRRREEAERRERDRERLRHRDYFDPILGTGLTVNDFTRGDRVDVHRHGEWFRARVSYTTVRTERVAVRYTGHNFDTTGVDPRTIRHTPREEIE